MQTLTEFPLRPDARISFRYVHSGGGQAMAAIN